MKKLILICAAALPMLAGTVVAPSIALAANAKTPYKNVNKTNDKGNNTGDAEVDKLNQQELAKIKTQ